MKRFLAAAFATASLLVGAAPALADTVNVPPGSDIGAAYQAAQPGDVLQLSAGAYPATTVNASKPVGSADVTIQGPSSAVVNNLTSYANEVHYKGFWVTNTVMMREGTNVLVELAGADKPYVWGTLDRAPTNLTFRGGVYDNGNADCQGGGSMHVKSYNIGSAPNPKNITIENLELTGYKIIGGAEACVAAGWPRPHQDCLHTFDVDGITIRGNRIHECEDFGILLNSNRTSVGANYLVENNFIWDSRIADFQSRGDACSSPSSCEEEFHNLTVRNNSWWSSIVGQAEYYNSVWQNNASVNNQDCSPRGGGRPTFGGNVAVQGVHGPCAGDWRVSSLGWVDQSAGDFHLTSSSPLADAATGASKALTDIDGQTRPIGSATDVGADERGAPAPPPDGDGDGFPDASDLCPTQAGIAPDGCPAPLPPDCTPKNVTATVTGGDDVFVNWDDLTNCPEWSYFSVRYTTAATPDPNNDAQWTRLPGDHTLSEVTHADLAPGTYHYLVRAVNASRQPVGGMPPVASATVAEPVYAPACEPTCDEQIAALTAARDTARAERDTALVERDTARAERDTALVERDTALVERDTARAERDTARAERDTARAERDALQSKLDRIEAIISE